MTRSAPKAGVIGWPVEHSLSPLIHRHWLQRHRLEGTYDLLPVAPDDIGAYLQHFCEHGLAGANVTVPHKETACRIAGKVSDLARRLGAANTLWLEDGELAADNTDVHGFVANLDERASGWDDGKTALIIGAGGAARAVIAGLADRGFDRIVIANRTLERATALLGWFAGEPAQLSAAPLDRADTFLAGADLIVNTTSAGLAGAAPLALDWSSAQATAIATDIVYVPLITPFLAGAAQAGLTHVDGLGMLLHQAAPGFRKWFGVMPDIDEELRSFVLAALAERH